jgi:hypothetical protein
LLCSITNTSRATEKAIASESSKIKRKEKRGFPEAQGQADKFTGYSVASVRGGQAVKQWEKKGPPLVTETVNASHIGRSRKHKTWP